MATEALKVARLQRKREREARSYEREQLLIDKVLTPNVMRLALLSAIIAYSTYCARSRENVGPVQSALAFALPGIGIPLIAADAGIHDKYALAAISAAGIGYTTGQMVQGWQEAGVSLAEITPAWAKGLQLLLPAGGAASVIDFLQEKVG